MRIGIDIDEVLADLIPQVLIYFNKKENTNHEKENIKKFDLSHLWKTTKNDTIQKIYEFYQSKEFEQTKPVKDSQKIIKKLTKKHELYAITARPELTKEKTVNWIKKHHPNMFKEIHFSNDLVQTTKKNKTQICKSLKIQVMIEDNLNYAKKIAKTGTKILLLNQPWNQTKKLPENIVRVKNWKEIEQKLTKITTVKTS
ncbi:hypothetical protein K9L97_02395 [Candidatus Woesearchaeota archaeon]|nr:hypothetical protein [Candidatus Woesearchaeota archaeon]